MRGESEQLCMIDRDSIVPPGEARAYSLSCGEYLRVINVEGQQVADCWAFVPPQFVECLSTEHTRSCLERLVPVEGDALYSNRRRPLLTLVEDNSPGCHDLLLSACDQRRYELLGHIGKHRNCADNLRDVLAAHGHHLTRPPSPFNIFENVTIEPGGELRIETPKAQAGDSVTLRAECDIVVVISACPMDIAKTNGPDGHIKPIGIEVLPVANKPA